jgi:hypothetical protein
MLTTETLENLNYCDDKHIKRLYNYQMARLREKSEMRDDTLQEFKWNLAHVEPFMQVIKR